MKLLSSQKGQTSVEYILMIVVVIFVGMGVFQKIEEYVITNPDSFVNTWLEAYRSGFGGEDGGVTANYRRFFVRR